MVKFDKRKDIILILCVILMAIISLDIFILHHKKSSITVIETIISEDLSLKSETVNLSEPVKISFGEINKQIITKHFLPPDNGGRWSEGKHAAIKMYINNYHSDIDVHITGVPFFGPTFKKQKVNIFANGNFIKTWEFDKHTALPDTIHFVVPQKYILNHQLELGFIVDNPKTPKELGINNDTRLIGFGIQTISLDLIKNKDKIDTDKLMPTALQLEFSTKNKKSDIIEIYVDGKLKQITPRKKKILNNYQKGSYNTYVIEVFGNKAEIEIIAKDKNSSSDLNFNIVIPKATMEENNHYEKLIYLYLIKQDGYTIVSKPLLVTEDKPLFVSLVNFSNSQQRTHIVVEWGTPEGENVNNVY